MWTPKWNGVQGLARAIGVVRCQRLAHAIGDVRWQILAKISRSAASRVEEMS
jgi:hypothetical protein